jgi:peptide/nickel transport system substrate-binding protein
MSRFLLMLLVVVGCAKPASAPAGPSISEPPPLRRAITVALQAEINAFTGGMNQLGIISTPSRYFHEFVNAYVTTRDRNDDVRPWLAVDVPSVEGGTWRVADDGSMAVTWKLRPGVKWHDGRSLTSDDVKFSWEAARDPATQLRPQGVAGLIDAVDTPDPSTVVFHWRRTSYHGGELSEHQMDLLPRHALEEPLLTDKDNFSNHPYFAVPERFVGTGPYRPVSWERGSHLTVEAFDGYFLGRPKIETVTFAFLRDANTALANVLAGAVDISVQAVPVEQARVVQEEWGKTGAGTVELQLNHVRHLLPQLRPTHASPADLLNVDVRRALAHAMDRPELAEATVPGAGRAATSVTHPDTPIGRAVAQRVVTYPHDPTRAAALLEAAGWRRGSDGVLQKAGERFTLEYRTLGAGDSKTLFPVLQQQYRQVGVDLQYFEVASANTPIDTALYPGVWFTSQVADSIAVFTRYHSRQIATAENRYAAGNRTGYASAAADRQIDRIETSLKASDRADGWAEWWRVLTDEVALLPMYYFPNPLIVRGGMTGPLPANPLTPAGHEVHTWEAR